MEASIADDLGADSLDVVDLVTSLEDEFDIEIPDEEIENIKTVGDVVKYYPRDNYRPIRGCQAVGTRWCALLLAKRDPNRPVALEFCWGTRYNEDIL